MRVRVTKGKILVIQGKSVLFRVSASLKFASVGVIRVDCDNKLLEYALVLLCSVQP